MLKKKYNLSLSQTYFSSTKWNKLWVALGGALILVLLVMSQFVITSQTLIDQEKPNPEALAAIDNQENLLQQDTLQVVQYFKAENGINNVANGDLITFTVFITNQGGVNITGIVVNDRIPPGALEDIRTNGDEVKLTQGIPSLRGGSIIYVERTDSIIWELQNDPLPPGQSRQLWFAGRVKCQTDGSILENTAFTDSDNGGTPNSNTVFVTVTVRAANSSADVSDGPTWCSNDVGGNFETDWGDYDQDGDLDLALGSTLGTTVYQNVDGRLELFWTKTNRFTLGLRWGDFTGDGQLELLALGESDASANATSPGTNYIYQYVPLGNTFTELDSFRSEFQLLRAAPGDYDGDGDLDIIASSTALDVEFPVRLFRNIYPETNENAFEDNGELISPEATGDVSAADFDNDGDLDIVLSRFISKDILVLRNMLDIDNDVLTENFTIDSPANIQLAQGISFPPYNFAWGDYNRDGYLDLAIALSLQREIHVYANSGGSFSTSPLVIRTSQFLSPRVIDWVDMNGDGWLDLVMADDRPKVYIFQQGTNGQPNQFIEDPNITLSATLVGSRVWSMRGVDYDNDGDLDMALSNQNDPMMLFTSFTPRLANKIIPLNPDLDASSVAWGDVNQDNNLDLLFGAGEDTSDPNDIHLKIFTNDTGEFPFSQVIADGAGPNAIAFGDIDSDGRLDIGVGNAGREDTVYLASSRSLRWEAATVFSTTSIAWGDADEDSDFHLDLLAGIKNGPNIVYFNKLNDQGQYVLSPGWQSNEQDNTTSVAWGNVNGYDTNLTADHNFDYQDGELDFVVGNYGQENRIYQNRGLKRFNLVWSAPFTDNTTSIAWGDYDQDGDLDLAVGNDGQPNYIYENQTLDGVVDFELVWSSGVSDSTTSLAWGDWDNDGDDDLAVGNYNTYDYIYVNQGSKPGDPRLDLLWQSSEAYSTTGVAWGDKDNDGDLDLAISQDNPADDDTTNPASSGIYENLSISPSHFTNSFDPSKTPLRNNPSYLSTGQPGQKEAAYYYSSGEMLKDDIAIPYTIYDPDGASSVRDVGTAGAPGAGNPIVGSRHEFSLNGGGFWQTATPATTPTLPIPYRQGVSGEFVWDATSDFAISENVVFRSCVFYQNTTGPTQQAEACSLSYPFRVRGTTCNWPDKGDILYNQVFFGKPIEFTGFVAVGSGTINYVWDFGDGTVLDTGSQIVYHTFADPGRHLITMTVTGDPCPISKPLVITKTVLAGGLIFLPVVMNNYSYTISSTIPTSRALSVGPAYNLSQASDNGPAPITGLKGEVDLIEQTTRLTWPAGLPEDQIEAYYIYRRGRSRNAKFERLAILPSDNTFYLDKDATCSYTYFVTAINRFGESPPSYGSYQTEQCP